jgi:hypothetical protein
LVSYIEGGTLTDGVQDWGMLRKTFGHKRKKVTGNWRELHSEELHDLYSSPNLLG